MFSYLEFGMVNSNGNTVVVKIKHKSGLISYELEFPDQKLEKISKKMSKGNSDKFIRKIKATGLETILPRFVDFGEFERGDFWHLDLVDSDYELHYSGPEPEKSVLSPYVQELMELFDAVFGVTSFVKPTRIDRLEVEYLECSVDEFSVMFSDLGDCSHSESLTLDRASWTLTYSRRFPRQCFHNSYECHCENQIRQILDQTSSLLEAYDLDEKLCTVDTSSPVLNFHLFYHDGREASFTKALRAGGVGNKILDALLCVIGDTLQYTMFAGGIFEPYTEAIKQCKDVV